jgi:hypothetical protein
MVIIVWVYPLLQLAVSNSCVSSGKLIINPLTEEGSDTVPVSKTELADGMPLLFFHHYYLQMMITTMAMPVRTPCLRSKYWK